MAMNYYAIQIFHASLPSCFLSMSPEIQHLSKNQQRLQLHGAICRPNSFVMMLRYCANLKAIRYDLNRIADDKSQRVIVAKNKRNLSLFDN